MKFFIIDDDHLSNFITKTILKVTDATIETISFLCCKEALKLLQFCEDKELPDVILLDLNMPEIDGWDLLDALSPYAEKFRNKSRIHILTSSLDIADTVRTKDYPMVASLIHKPMKVADVFMILHGK